MHIQHAGLHHAAQGMGAQHALNRRKRIVKGAFHKHLPQHLGHQHLAPAPVLKHPVPPPGRALGKIHRPQDTWLGLDEL